ncbi:MAG: hypothetical protein WD356_09795 [Pseudomonadales bacterium]
MKKLITFTIALCLGLIQGGAHGATDGEPDVSSRGEIRIALQLVPSLQIDTVNIVDVVIRDRSVDAHFSESFCVTGTPESRYQLHAYGSGPGSDFVLDSLQGGRLEYNLSFRGNPKSSSFDPLTPGKLSPAYDAFKNASKCNDATAFRVTFRSEELAGTEPGTYTGNLTLVVSPE